MTTSLAALGGPSEWTCTEGTPLARAMAELAVRVIRQIVVRSPVIALLHETTHMSAAGVVHEVTARTGLLLRSPITLLRLRRPSSPPPRPEPLRRA